MNKNISIKQVIIILLMIFTCGKLSAIEFEVGGIIYNSSNGNNVSVEGKINDYFGAIAIPETVTYQGVNYAVTRISEDAFWHDTDITSIIIPPTILFIDERAFDGCINLDTIYISSIESWCNIGFDKIDSNPLVYAKHLYIDGKEVNDIAIPEGITYIDEYAFCKFQGIRSLTLPKSLTRIWKSAFSDCSNLEIVISKCDTPPSFYGDNISPFSGISSKAKLLVPQGAIRTYISLSKWSNYFAEIVEDVNESSNIISFTDANVKEICIANWDSNGDGELSKEEASAVTDIGRAFRKSSIGIFPEFKYFTGLSYVGEEAFEKCSRLSYIIIPPNVKSLYYQAFKECGFTSFTIPDGVENIGGAFGGCSKLAIVKIPASVKSISSNIFPHTVSSIIIDKNNETYSSPNSNCIYDKLTNTLVFATKSTKISNGTIHIGDGAFIGVELTEIEIPNTVKTIGKRAFCLCTNLRLATLSNALITIDESAFAWCRNLATIGLPNTLETIGANAFLECTSLSSITIPQDVTTLQGSAFMGCTGLTSATVKYKGVLPYQLFANCTQLKTVTLSNGITSIGNNVFAECSSLSSIEIPNTVTSIGESAFSSCI